MHIGVYNTVYLNGSNHIQSYEIGFPVYFESSIQNAKCKKVSELLIEFFFSGILRSLHNI